MNFQVSFNVDVGDWVEGSKDVTENVLFSLRIQHLYKYLVLFNEIRFLSLRLNIFVVRL